LTGGSGRRGDHVAAEGLEPAAPASRARGVGTIDYRVKFVKGHAYLYERTYVGSAGDSKPIRTEKLLGRVDDARARIATQAEMSFMAVAIKREKAAHATFRSRSAEAEAPMTGRRRSREKPR
jgi:hypothetical protein